jgi:hypothetical protein
VLIDPCQLVGSACGRVRRAARRIEGVRKAAEFVGRIPARHDCVAQGAQALDRGGDVVVGRDALVDAVRSGHGPIYQC